MSSDTKERKAFEAWAKARSWKVERDGHCYKNPILQASDSGWQGHAAAVSATPVYAFRRKGFDDFCTCTIERYEELLGKQGLFEVAIFYAIKESP